MFKKIIIILSLVMLLGLEVFVKSGNISPLVFQILFNNKIELKTAEPQRINILLLGIGGEGHDGPKLTDTIILASLNLKDPKINLISLPRDMWSFDINGRINSAYKKGEEKKNGGGLVLAKSVVSKITGQPIDYGIRIDFSGFIKAVDLVGGLDINVDRTFDDYQYPLEGNENEPCGHTEDEVKVYAAGNSAESDLPNFFPCRYEHLHFDKGENHMDGETALKFVRSRHAKGDEGTDFARSKRQEKVIKAFMDKVFSLNIIANPGKAIGLYDTVKNSVDSDVNQNELDDFVKLAQKFKNAKLESIVIDVGDPEKNRGGLLTHPSISEKYNFEWTLVPRNGTDNYSEISEYIRCNLNQEKCSISEIQ